MASMLYKWLIISGFLFLVGLPRPGVAAPAKEHHPSLTLKEGQHPFYVSVTEINQNAKEKTLEISCKVFAEDLEETLKKNYKTTVDLSLAGDKGALDKFIPDYINKHLSLVVDGKPVRLSYVGYEKDKESAYCYFQVDNVVSLKKLDIINSILYDFNEGQINIMHVVVNGKRQSLKLNNPDKQASLAFNS
jgi:hypothetical protein